MLKALGDDVTVRELRTDELSLAAAVLSRSMRDNPLNQCVFVADAAQRELALRHFFQVLLKQCQAKGAILGTFAAATLVGVCAVVSPGQCQAAPWEKFTLFRTLVPGNSLVTLLTRPGVGTIRRRLIGTWSRGRRRELQGRGIGTALLGAAREWMDRRRPWHTSRTDKHVNVTSYERFGQDDAAMELIVFSPTLRTW